MPSSVQCAKCPVAMKTRPSGLLNERSDINKDALIQDSLCHGALDTFASTQTWITSDAPSCIITNSPTQDRFITTHQQAQLQRESKFKLKHLRRYLIESPFQFVVPIVVVVFVLLVLVSAMPAKVALARVPEDASGRPEQGRIGGRMNCGLLEGESNE